MWLSSLSRRGRLNRLPNQLLRQIVLKTLQIKCVKQLEREHKLPQLNLTICPSKIPDPPVTARYVSS